MSSKQILKYSKSSVIKSVSEYWRPCKLFVSGNCVDLFTSFIARVLHLTLGIRENKDMPVTFLLYLQYAQLYSVRNSACMERDENAMGDPTSLAQMAGDFQPGINNFESDTILAI